MGDSRHPLGRSCMPSPDNWSKILHLFNLLITKMRALPPFIVFEQQLLQTLKVAPSQLHINRPESNIDSIPRGGVERRFDSKITLAEFKEADSDILHHEPFCVMHKVADFSTRLLQQNIADTQLQKEGNCNTPSFGALLGELNS